MINRSDFSWGVSGLIEQIPTTTTAPPDRYRWVVAAVIEQALKEYALGIELMLDTPEFPTADQEEVMRKSDDAFKFLTSDTLYHRYLDLSPDTLKKYLFQLEEQVYQTLNAECVA